MTPRQPESLHALLRIAQGAYDMAWDDGELWRIEMWDRRIASLRERIAGGETEVWYG